jgi:hypothetical protein
MSAGFGSWLLGMFSRRQRTGRDARDDQRHLHRAGRDDPCLGCARFELVRQIAIAVKFMRGLRQSRVQELANFMGTEIMMNHSRGITKAAPLLIGIGFLLSACAADLAPTYPDSWLDFEDTASCINEEHCHLEPSIFAGELAGPTASAVALR